MKVASCLPKYALTTILLQDDLVFVFGKTFVVEVITLPSLFLFHFASSETMTTAVKASNGMMCTHGLSNNMDKMLLISFSRMIEACAYHMAWVWQITVFHHVIKQYAYNQNDTVRWHTQQKLKL